MTTNRETYDKIRACLMEYTCQHIHDEEGDGLPLVDALSSGESIAGGVSEIDLLADDLSVVVERALDEKDRQNEDDHELVSRFSSTIQKQEALLKERDATIEKLSEDADKWRSLENAVRETKAGHVETPLEERVNHLAAEIAVGFLNSIMTPEATTALKDEIIQWVRPLANDLEEDLAAERERADAWRNLAIRTGIELFIAWDSAEVEKRMESEVRKLLAERSKEGKPVLVDGVDGPDIHNEGDQ